MKNNFTRSLFILFILLLALGKGQAQCPAGYSQSELNWDNIDFLPSNNIRYTSFYPNPAFPYTQHFAMGTRTLTMEMAPVNTITLDGENGSNGAHAGSFATAGDDVQFTTTSTSGNTIILTFDTDVANLMFSLFDLDNSQRVNVTAVNTAAVAQTVDLVRASGTSGITIAGSGSTSATATGPWFGYGNNDNRGTLNVTIAGPVKQITITLDNAAGDIWLSDIDACITGAFPNNYQQISRPFTGQPQYVLTVVNNNIYYTDPTNGNAYFLFNEPGHNRLNSMAYDPYRRIVYYTYSLGPDPTNDRTVKKYDVDSKTISVLIPNVNDFGIPTYESGVESGSASFYNGSLYLGIEGYTGTSGGGSYAAGRKSTIWKIDFDAAGNPLAPASQVFGVTADDGSNSQNIHDWSDFGISNGVLYDFDGSGSGDIDYYHFDLMTGTRSRYAPTGGVVPRQVSIGWDENLYNVDASIAMYNGTDGVGTRYTIFSPLGPTIPTGRAASWGDAAGPYRPFLDFGDAPASYDPDPLSPACHDTLTPTNTKLRLGPAEDVEWLKRGFTTVEDNFEDGLAFVPIFTPTTGSYQAEVSVFNNTGSNATLCAWLDFNGNGLFDASEAILPITVPSSAGTQMIWLSWPGTPSTLPFGTYTYLRIRITAASYGMNAGNATGYYSTGEVEDYQVVVDGSPLSVNMFFFEAKVTDDRKVRLSWAGSEEIILAGYDIERRSNEGDGGWQKIAHVAATHRGTIQEYVYTDNDPYKGVSFYRLKLNSNNNQYHYSNIQTVEIEWPDLITLFPNPAIDKASLIINNAKMGQSIRIRITDIGGNLLSYQQIILNNGINTIHLPIGPDWRAGTYFVLINTGEMIRTKKLLIRK